MKKNKNGLNTELLENGMTLQTNYDNGLKNGIEIYWYANGQKASEGSYLKNKLEGRLPTGMTMAPKPLKASIKMISLRVCKPHGMRMVKLSLSKNTKMGF